MQFKSMTMSLVALLGVAPITASALSITFTGDQGNYDATAKFTQTGSTLTIVLTNTSNVLVSERDYILTGLFFNLMGNPVLTPVSAALTAGSTLLNSADSLNNQWATRDDIALNEYTDATLKQVNGRYGISAVGLDIFGGGDLFTPHANPSPAGVDFGIVGTAGYDASKIKDGNKAMPLVKNSVTFTFTLPSTSPVSITNVGFHYGSSQNQRTVLAVTPPVPGPAAVMPFLAGLAVAMRRRRRA